MKKAFETLMQLCPGRLVLRIDDHILYGETAEQVILRETKQFAETQEFILEEMADKNTIIMVEAATTTKPMPVVQVYHYDIELALKEAIKQIKKWKPAKN